ncbi:MAG: hypothetical protein ABIH83_03030 [Candidatus Micrarchaeota archaeon]
MLFDYVISFIIISLKGVFYFYMFLISLYLLIAVLAIFISLGGINILNQILLFFKLQLIAMGVPESGSFSYYGGIPQEVLLIFGLACSIAGFIGTKLMGWWKKGKISAWEEAKMLVLLCIGANIAVSIIFFIFSVFQKNADILASFGITLLQFIILSITGAIALSAYALARLIEYLSNLKLTLGQMQIHRPSD